MGTRRPRLTLTSKRTLTTNRVRTERRNGREYLVAPVTMIVPGVLQGSRGALYYPPDEIARNHEQWNGVRLTVGHPVVDGKPVSALSKDVKPLGRVRNARVDGQGRLKAEAWFDVRDTETLAPSLLPGLRQGQKVEVSTGLYTENVPTDNGEEYVDPKGRRYSLVARNYKADHLAVLLDQNGACSVSDGCGLNVNAEKTPENKGQTPTRNAPPVNQPRSKVTGRLKRMNAGTGIGEAHEAAQEGHMVLTDRQKELGRQAAAHKRRTGHNPAAWVRDHAKWERAKRAAAKYASQGNDVFYAVVTHIYENMGGRIGSPKKGKDTRNAGGVNQKALRQALKSLPEGAMPGYGQTFIKGSEVWYVGGDGDTREFHEATRKILAKVSGVAKVTYEAETFPPRDGGWVRVDNTGNETNDTGPTPEASMKTKVKLTDQKRQGYVTFLTTNCDCWKGDDAAEVLNGFSDDRLTNLVRGAKRLQQQEAVLNGVAEGLGIESGELVANAMTMPAFIKKKMGKKIEDEEEDEEEVPAKKKKTENAEKVSTSKPARPLSFEDWIEIAPAEAKEVWNASVEAHDEAKEELIDRLVGNAEDDDGPTEEQKAARAVYKGMTLKQLKSLAAVTNSRPSSKGFLRPGQSRVEDEDDDLPNRRQPLFLGNGGGSRGQGKGGSSDPTFDNEPLVMPTMNYEELSVFNKKRVS